MKFILSSVCAIALTLSAFAGLQVDSVLIGGTNSVAANTTNSYQGVPFYFGDSTDATLWFRFNCGAASTANYTITFDTSLDNASWVTNSFMWQIAGNGVSTNSFITNLTKAQTYPFYRVGQIWNTNASSPAISNITVKAWSKKGE